MCFWRRLADGDNVSEAILRISRKPKFIFNSINIDFVHGSIMKLHKQI